MQMTINEFSARGIYIFKIFKTVYSLEGISVNTFYANKPIFSFTAKISSKKGMTIQS